jgi:hypothetical protein
LTAAAFTITGTVDLETGDNCYQLDTRTSEQSSDESKCVYWTTYYPLFLAANATAQDGTSYIVMWLDPQVDIVSAAEWGSYRDASGWTVFTAAQPPPSAMHLSARVEGQLVECEVGAMLACDEA